jgi:choline-sulfatase
MQNKKTRKSITRRNFLQKSGLAGASILATQYLGCTDPKALDDESIRRNIVYIFVDQHRGDFLGATGHPTVQTPNIDWIANRGVTFTNCFSNAPLCCPARASMMTGQYPREHQCWNNEVSADKDGVSHVRRMRDEAGYFTSLIGKAHLHLGHGHLSDYQSLLEDWGFKHTQEILGFIQKKIRSEYTDWLSESTAAGQTDKYLVLTNYFTQLDDYWNDPWHTPAIDEEPWLLDPEDHIDLYNARQAARWIQNYDEDSPFYLQVNFPGPHTPFDAPKRFRELYDVNDERMPPGILEAIEGPQMRLARKAMNFQNITSITAEDRNLLQVLYNAKISVIDEGVGRVLTALREKDLLDNTWLVYCSDHGEMLGDHLLAGKAVFYESSVRVPLIMSPPGGMAPQKSEALVDQLDVTASILQMGGLENDQHGRSLLPKINGEEDINSHNEYVISEDQFCGMVRDRRYKLVMDYVDERASKINPRVVQFFDLEADPQELVNLVDSAEVKSEVTRMREIMESDDLLQSEYTDVLDNEPNSDS